MSIFLARDAIKDRIYSLKTAAKKCHLSVDMLSIKLIILENIPF